MRQAGLTPTPVWKPGDKEELQRALAENEERFREPLMQEEAETKRRHSNTGAMPTCCLAFLPRAVKVAREHGYALTVHGTLARDYDFVAVPWVENAAPPQELVNAMLRACGGFISPEDAGRLPIHKPHGRLCWPIHLGAGPYIDLSIMQPNNQVERP